MTKILLIDADGVLIKSKYFSNRLSEKYGIPLEDILPFFKNEFKRCVSGQADLKEEIAKYIPKWGWKGTVDELLDFWFSGYELDEKILGVIKIARSRGIKCYLASDIEKYRAQYMMPAMGLESELDGTFFSYETGCTKSERCFFENVLKKFPDVKPEEVAYCDDDKENVEEAKQLGINAEFFRDSQSFENWVNILM